MRVPRPPGAPGDRLGSSEEPGSSDEIDEERLVDPERLEIAEVFAQEHHEPRARIGDASPLVENQWYESLEQSPMEPPKRDPDEGPAKEPNAEPDAVDDLLAELEKAKRNPETL